jgi:hypothetical protein
MMLMPRWLLLPLLLGALFVVAYGDPPASQPSDPTMSWLLSQATTAPSDAPDDVPATQPSVLVSTGPANVTRPGVLVLSDGHSFQGKLSTTLGQPIHLWDDSDQHFHDIPFSMIRSIEARIVWERQEPEWEFAESGSDVKQFSGKTYPARKMEYILTLKDGSSETGGVAAPIYFDGSDGPKVYILHKRDKGPVGQTLTDLVYVKSIRFSD